MKASVCQPSELNASDVELWHSFQRATDALERLGELATDALRKAAAGKSSAEARRRLVQLLARRVMPRTRRASAVVAMLSAPVINTCAINNCQAVATGGSVIDDR